MKEWQFHPDVLVFAFAVVFSALPLLATINFRKLTEDLKWNARLMAIQFNVHIILSKFDNIIHLLFFSQHENDHERKTRCSRVCEKVWRDFPVCTYIISTYWYINGLYLRPYLQFKGSAAFSCHEYGGTYANGTCEYQFIFIKCQFVLLGKSRRKNINGSTIGNPVCNGACQARAWELNGTWTFETGCVRLDLWLVKLVVQTNLRFQAKYGVAPPNSTVKVLRNGVIYYIWICNET